MCQILTEAFESTEKGMPMQIKNNTDSLVQESI